MCFKVVSFSLLALPPKGQTTTISLPGWLQHASKGPLLPSYPTYLHFPLSNQSTLLKHVHLTIWLLPTFIQGLSQYIEEKSNPSVPTRLFTVCQLPPSHPLILLTSFYPPTTQTASWSLPVLFPLLKTLPAKPPSGFPILQVLELPVDRNWALVRASFMTLGNSLGFSMLVPLEMGLLMVTRVGYYCLYTIFSVRFP